MKKILEIILVSYSCFNICLPVFSEDNNDTLTITVTGTRTEKNVDDIPASIKVIDLEDTRQKGSSELKDLIKYEPGISVYDPREINYRSSNGTRGSASSGNVNIRGLSNNRVLMQRDGIRFPAGFYAVGYDYSSGNAINYCSLSSVDVLKGPASALYGSDALGGVISFNSLKAEDLLDKDESFKIETPSYFNGSNNGKSNAFRLAGISEDDSLSLISSICINSSNEVNPSGAEDKFVNKADIKNESIYIRVDKRLNDSNEISILLDNYQKEKKVKRAEGNLSGEYLSQKSNVNTKKDLYYISWNFLSMDENSFFEKVNAKAYYQNQHISDLWLEEKKLEDLTSDYNHYDKSYGFELQFGSPFENHFLTYGIDYSLTENIYLQDKVHKIVGFLMPTYRGDEYPIKRSPDSATQRLGFYLQDEIEYKNFEIIGGLRFDNYKIIPSQDSIYQNYCSTGENTCPPSVPFEESKPTPKIAITYPINKELEIWGQYSKGFRAPSWWEKEATHINRNYNYQVLPNDELKSESSNSFEIGLRGDYKKYNFEITGFFNKYTDFINEYQYEKCGTDNDNDNQELWDELTRECYELSSKYGDTSIAATSTNKNIAEARIWGIELTNKYKFGSNKNGFSFFASSGYTHGQDTISNKPLSNIDPFKVVSGIEYVSKNDKFKGELISTYVGKKRLDSETIFLPEPYITFDLLGQYKYSEFIQLSFGIHNLFNKTYYHSNNVGSVQSSQEGIEQFAEPGRHFRFGFNFIF